MTASFKDVWVMVGRTINEIEGLYQPNKSGLQPVLEKVIFSEQIVDMKPEARPIYNRILDLWYNMNDSTNQEGVITSLKQVLKENYKD